MTRADERGQTLHDFAIGMVLFLLVLGYVFAFIPQLFSPFTPATDSSALRVDRTADFLTQDALAERRPNVGDGNRTDGRTLDPVCTEDFFNGSGIEQCPTAADNVTRFVGLPEESSVNVTMERNGEIARYNGTGSDTRLATGPEPNVDAKQVVRAVRVVSLDGRDYQFVVRLW